MGPERKKGVRSLLISIAIMMAIATYYFVFVIVVSEQNHSLAGKMMTLMKYFKLFPGMAE